MVEKPFVSDRDHRVVALSCDSYKRVKQVVKTGIGLLGGVGGFVKPGERIVLKPNLLFGDEPEHGTTTRPEFFEAVIDIFQSAGVKLQYGDSPGFGPVASAARGAGLADVAEANAVELADFANGVDIRNPVGNLIKSFNLANGVLAADGVINLPKFKTHALTRLTGAVKNHFGCLPGVQKTGFHARLSNEFEFSEMLVDLAELVGSRLHIMDGIVGMEGNGPRNGMTRKVGVVLISANPHALDYVVARIMSLDPSLVPTLNVATSRGLLVPNDIALLGDPIEAMEIPDFKVNRSRVSTTGEPGFWSKFVKNWITPRPVINSDRCTRCGRCVKVCPAEPKALGFTSGKQTPPQYDYDHCIRCYCCQEMCPEEAISVEKPALGKLLDHVMG